MTQEEKNQLCEYKITINGKPAKIVGRLLDFPFVAEVDGPLASVFSWKTIARVISNGGNFKA